MSCVIDALTSDLVDRSSAKIDCPACSGILL